MTPEREAEIRKAMARCEGKDQHEWGWALYALQDAMPALDRLRAENARLQNLHDEEHNELLATEESLRAENAKLREAAGRVLKTCYEMHTLERGEGYLAEGDAIDALRRAMESHHENYKEPEKVHWLCRGCHKQKHMESEQ